MPQITDEQMVAFQEFLARFAPKPRREGPDPSHRGVIDPDFVRPEPREYPRMMHHAQGMTKIVFDRAEQEALGKAWSTMPVKRPTDWKAKFNEVFTASGFRVHEHHLEFLKASNAPSMVTLQDAARFLDLLDAEQQEQFFREAEDFQIAEVVHTETKRSTKKN